jgi:dipeptidyl aminopeptidase/acylaminoacyl peptidase
VSQQHKSVITSRVLAASLLATAACITLAPRSPAGTEDPGYRTPPQVVADILTAPRIPRGPAKVSPDGAYLVLPDLPPMVPIATLAEPVDKLAGLEVLPAYWCTRSQLKSAWAGFWVARISDSKKVRAKFPADVRLGSVTWSNRGDRLACVVYAEGGGELWIVDAASGDARRVGSVHLNTVTTAKLDWSLADDEIFCSLAVFTGAAPPGDAFPIKPRVRVGAGRATPQRTSPAVLSTEYDRRRFLRAVVSQLAGVSIADSCARAIGTAAMILSWDMAPDEKHVILHTVTELPFGFPYYLFPREVAILGLDGSRIAQVGAIPLNDRSAISSVAPLGPRGWQWGFDGKSVWYFSWQDKPGADAFAAVRDTTLPQPGTDRLMRLDAPFNGAPRIVITSDHQLYDQNWTGSGRKLVVDDGYQPRRRERVWWIDPTEREPKRHMLVDRSTEGSYDNPGTSLGRSRPHQYVLWTSADDRVLYLAGDGFRPDGQRPFLDAWDLRSGRPTRRFESAGDVLESVSAMLSENGERFVTLRQSNIDPPNYYARATRPKVALRLSDYRDPAPALTASKRLQFTFLRPDSVRLNAEAVLPGSWKGERLPTIFWVYPNDYRSAAAASQNRRAPNRFPSQSPLNPEVLVTQGYAVVYPDLAVVGNNDRYVEEIRISAKAVFDEVWRRGFCDTSRVGVGGHSYGAFSTANLLAHTTFFKAGVASDGAYNRTLTPFTFQMEERTLWQARDTYIDMSPFLHADKITRPLLLLHNLDDTNVGTFPLQSDRMYEALNGMGKTVAIVEYPYEDHAPAARETVLDYWARVIEWYDRWVKGAGPASVERP